MNIVLTFLAQNWQRLGLERFGPASALSSVIATPRFRASSHVIFFIMAPGQPSPFLVVKTPRLTGDHGRLDGEAENLRLVHSAQAGGFASIPRLVAYEDYVGYRLLIETALAGETMSVRLRRHQPEPYVQAATNWLIELHGATAKPGASDSAWYERLMGRRLQQFCAAMPLATDELRLVEQSQTWMSSLDATSIPLVFEHGDLGPVNIMFSKTGQLGVVDWELAEPKGLPAADLFFLLTIAAPAWRRAQTPAAYVAAFHETFFGPAAWARPYVRRYAESLHLTPEQLKPLFVLCWSRYLVNLVTRLHDFETANQSVENDTLAWLRSNRYYAVWRHTVEHINELNLC